jgi:LPS-assembly protein
MLILSVGAAAQNPPPAATGAAPPALPPKSIPFGEWNVLCEICDTDGTVHKWHGHPVEMEDSRMLFRADDIEYDEGTGEVHAAGHVYFHSFDRNEQIWADHLQYNTQDEKGKFFDVRGETHPRIATRAGMLTTNSPFHFEGQWAERIGEKYVLYQGWVTNCQMPNPWWRMRGPKFDIIPGQRAIAYRSVFLLRKMPLFYTPFFYHSLEREPRKSGFLTPNVGHSSQRGFMLGVGYYWAIKRSYDLTYLVQDYTARGFAHHVDFRGKPREGTDFDAILYGVQDRGAPNSGTPPQKYSGASLYVTGKSDLGDGWMARGTINYISSFRFRQEWTQSFNEAIGSEIHSVGFLNKNWSTYTFNAIFARQENFQRAEVPVTDPATGKSRYVADAVTIRKLPEAELSSRDHLIWKNIPLWFSFQSAAGLLYRAEPVFDSVSNPTALVDTFRTGQFMNRVNLAPHLTTAFHWGSFHLVPSFGIRETYYGEAQAPYQDRFRVIGTNIVRSARDFSADLIFPSLARIYNKKTVFGDKLKHVIEPRATYRYVTGIGDDFNRFIRFDETDLLSNTNELELSLTNRIYAKRGDSVQEIFTWELLQKRYFDPTFGGALAPGVRNVFESTADLTGYAFLVGPRSTSPVVSLLRMSPINGLGVQWQADYDPRRHGIVDSTFSVDYRWQKYFVSAGNNAVHNDPALTPNANQFLLRTGFGDPNHRGWNAAMVAVYDYRKAVLQYSTVQVTYNTDCCGISVEYHRYNIGILDKSEWRVAFAVANIGSFGTLRKQDRVF